MSVARRLLFVVGMKREAALIPGSGAAICSGGDVGLLERRLAAVDPGGLDGVVSFGLAGGLDPALAPGDLVLATSVIAPPHSFSLDPDLSSERLAYRLFHEPGVRVFEPHAVKAQCSCSRPVVEAMLKNFSQDDRDHMVENGKISVTCEFCSSTYAFQPEEVGAKAG